jgi:hypothetical protein
MTLSRVDLPQSTHASDADDDTKTADHGLVALLASTGWLSGSVSGSTRGAVCRSDHSDRLAVLIEIIDPAHVDGFASADLIAHDDHHEQCVIERHLKSGSKVLPWYCSSRTNVYFKLKTPSLTFLRAAIKMQIFRVLADGTTSLASRPAISPVRKSLTYHHVSNGTSSQSSFSFRVSSSMIFVLATCARDQRSCDQSVPARSSELGNVLCSGKLTVGSIALQVRHSVGVHGQDETWFSIGEDNSGIVGILIATIIAGETPGGAVVGFAIGAAALWWPSRAITAPRMATRTGMPRTSARCSRRTRGTRGDATGARWEPSWLWLQAVKFASEGC